MTMAASFIGALASNTATAAHQRIRREYPVLARAILAGATQQLRNKATAGGNLCQRTRCYYFYQYRSTVQQARTRLRAAAHCAGSTAFTRSWASSDQCIATYPGDMAVALAALDAKVETQGPAGSRSIAKCAAFHRLPGIHARRIDNVLEPGEIITGIALPPPVGGKQLYRKVRDRASYAFALVSVAAVIGMEDGKHLATLRWRSAASRTSRGTDERGSMICSPAPTPSPDPFRQGRRPAARPGAWLWR